MLVETALLLAGWFLLRRGHTNKNKHTKSSFFSSYCCADGALKMNVEWKAKNTAMVLYLCFMHAVYSQRMPNNTNLRLSFIFLVETRNTYLHLFIMCLCFSYTYLPTLYILRYCVTLAYIAQNLTILCVL